MKSLEEKVLELENSNQILQHRIEESSERIVHYSDGVGTLTSRVDALEQSRLRTNTVVVRTVGEPLRCINFFLFQTVNQTEWLNRLFDLLFQNRKKFHLYVTKLLKMELLPILRMTICNEIRTHYAAWRFLAVMD
jgi:hypothetical protein